MKKNHMVISLQTVKSFVIVQYYFKTSSSRETKRSRVTQ